MDFKKKYTTLEEVLEVIIDNCSTEKNDLPKRFFYNHFTEQKTLIRKDFRCNKPKKNWIFPSLSEVKSDDKLWEEIVFPVNDFTENIYGLKQEFRQEFQVYNFDEFDDYNSTLREFDLPDEYNFSISISNWLNFYFKNELPTITGVGHIKRDMRKYRRKVTLSKFYKHNKKSKTRNISIK